MAGLYEENPRRVWRQRSIDMTDITISYHIIDMAIKQSLNIFSIDCTNLACFGALSCHLAHEPLAQNLAENLIDHGTAHSQSNQLIQ